MSVDVETRRAVEAIVLAATEPVHPTVMAQLLEVSVEVIDELCAQLAAEYEAQGRGFQLARVAGGYRFQTHPDAYAYVERFVLDGQTARLVGSGAGDARDHRLQAAGVARAAVGDPRRERRRDVEDAGRARLRRRDRPRSDARATRRCSRPRGCSSNGSASTRSPTCPRSPTSCPRPRWSRRSSAACCCRRHVVRGECRR